MYSYIPLLQNATPKTCKPVIFIGNKTDLKHDRVLSKEEAEAVLEDGTFELGGGRIKHFETSAKNNNNVTEVNVKEEYYPAVYVSFINLVSIFREINISYINRQFKR